MCNVTKSNFVLKVLEMYLTLIQMTLKVVTNIIQMNFHRGKTFDFLFLLLLVQLVLQNKMDNTINLETQDQRVHQSN